METTQSRSRHWSSIRDGQLQNLYNFSYDDVDADSNRWEVQCSIVDCKKDKQLQWQEASMGATPLTAHTPCRAVEHKK